jgi:hypothetical protein
MAEPSQFGHGEILIGEPSRVSGRIVDREQLEKIRRFRFAAIHAAGVFRIHRFAAFLARSVVAPVGGNFGDAVEELGFGGFGRGKQHVLERLNTERLPIHSGLELAKSGP